ncbi:uncharacterized protein DSM5745_03867 [Aspergillus mulundensis]|uniref:Uncharacterized protein n=1 Tax=Aspergillus mulundensis TaxID=1810919 RepID=A0A3D8SBJ0_9EURO|nr:hypothetical protein DSM5745_03867 [Aspergillus mulundensis]RDW83541.1 hypothetical protein DSM5745_03867 [Aspergillus mulundensis]
MVALSMADGYARVTNEPHAATGRAPVLIFAGLSPFTLDGERRGNRTEYIHWLQDVPDQNQIVARYCKYTGEIRTGKNVKQMVGAALQFATSDPKGSVYLMDRLEDVLTEAIGAVRGGTSTVVDAFVQ